MTEEWLREVLGRLVATYAGAYDEPKWLSRTVTWVPTPNGAVTLDEAVQLILEELRRNWW